MSARTDRNDLVRLALTYTTPKRCPGGRLVNDGYCCVLCGSPDPDKVCELPKSRHTKE